MNESKASGEFSSPLAPPKNLEQFNTRRTKYRGV